MAKYFEMRWGIPEIAKHFIITGFGTNLFMLVYYLFRLGTPRTVAGLGPIIFGYLIAFKRAVPEHKIVIFKTLSMRVKVVNHN